MRFEPLYTSNELAFQELRSVNSTLSKKADHGTLDLPKIDWLLDKVPVMGVGIYNEWCRDMRDTYGDSFLVAANLALTPMKQDKKLSGQYYHRMALDALSLEFMLEELRAHSGDYKDELVAAALDTSRGSVTELSEHRHVCQYMLDGEELWFPFYIPMVVQNYIFHLKEAEGQPFTVSTIRTVINRALCRKQQNLQKFASLILSVYMMYVSWLCSSSEKAADKAIASLNTKSGPSSVPIAGRLLPSEVRESMGEKKDVLMKIGLDLQIQKFEDLDSKELYTAFNATFPSYDNNVVFPLLAAAASGFGLPENCHFHYALLLLMESVIGKDPTILTGTQNYAIDESADTDGCSDEQLIQDPATGKFIGAFKGGYAEHIMGRILFTAALIDNTVQGYVAETYRKTASERDSLNIRVKSMEKDAESGGKKARQANKVELEATIKNQKLAERVAELERKLHERNAYIADLEAARPEDPEEPEEDVSPQEDDVPIEYPVRVQKGFRVMIYGGHASWVREMKQRFPDIPIRTGRYAYTVEGVKKCALILVQNNAISHSAFAPVMDETRQYKIPLGYFEKAGVNTCSRQLYTILSEMNAIEA